MVEKSKPKTVFVGCVVVTLLLLCTYYYPRLLIARLGEANPWTSYLYQYGFGLIVFVVGLWVILKTGACKLGRGRDSLWFGVLLAGFAMFSTLHALWIVAAQNLPYLGE